MAAFVAMIGVTSVVAQVCILIFNNWVLWYSGYCFIVVKRLHDDYSLWFEDYRPLCFDFRQQTALMAILMRQLGLKQTIIVGLVFEMLQLFMLGFFAQHW